MSKAALESIAKKFKVKCICGSQMTIKHTMSAYNSSIAWCDGCKKKMTKDEYSYHCPKERNPKHFSGFDYCFDCAQIRYEKQKNDKLNDELSLIYHEKYSNINTTNINQLFKELAMFQEKELKVIQALNKIIKAKNDDEKEENNLPKLQVPQTKLHQNVSSLQKMINIQKSMSPLLSKLLNTHLSLMSNWKDWTITDVIHWMVSVDNGAYKQYEVQLTQGATEENLIGNNLIYVTEDTLRRWQVSDIGKRNRLLEAIKLLIRDKTNENADESQPGLVVTTANGQQEGK